jgi:hypothetical protein
MVHQLHQSSVRRGIADGLVVGSLSLATGAFRLAPHLPNFTPVGALGLFSGAQLSWWRALLVPLCVMAASDLVLEQVYGYAPFHPFVYVSIGLNVVLGRLCLRGTMSPWRLGGVSLLASIQFFLVTNFGVWAQGNMYPPTLAGLVQCYAAGVPFFQYTVLGDLTFVTVMFGARAFAMRVAPRWAPSAGNHPLVAAN